MRISDWSSGVCSSDLTYDAETGKQLWRFHIVPGDPALGFENKAMEMAARTWSGEWWKNGGGGTAWNAMTYDPEQNLIYIGTGNGSPWSHQIRSNGKRSEEHTSELQSLMRISYAVFCLKKKNKQKQKQN